MFFLNIISEHNLKSNLISVSLPFCKLYATNPNYHLMNPITTPILSLGVTGPFFKTENKYTAFVVENRMMVDPKLSLLLVHA